MQFVLISYEGPNSEVTDSEVTNSKVTNLSDTSRRRIASNEPRRDVLVNCRSSSSSSAVTRIEARSETIVGRSRRKRGCLAAINSAAELSEDKEDLACTGCAVTPAPLGVGAQARGGQKRPDENNVCTPESTHNGNSKSEATWACRRTRQQRHSSRLFGTHASPSDGCWLATDRPVNRHEIIPRNFSYAQRNMIRRVTIIAAKLPPASRFCFLRDKTAALSRPCLAATGEGSGGEKSKIQAYGDRVETRARFSTCIW